MELFILGLIILLQSPSALAVSSNSTQCRPMGEGRVNFPVRSLDREGKSNIDCQKMFQRLGGQTLYFHDDHDINRSLPLRSHFFKYPEAVNCFDDRENLIDCPGLDIEQVYFSENVNQTFIATILHPDGETGEATVKLLNNDEICQISFTPMIISDETDGVELHGIGLYKAEVYNVLALYDGRLDQNQSPVCDEETLAMSSTSQDDEARALCKNSVDQSLKEALERIDPRDHGELRKRAEKFKRECDTDTPNQMKTNFFLTPSLDF